MKRAPAWCAALGPWALGLCACVGLIPAAFSTGIGSQVQRPLALVVVGGMLLAPVLILLVLPVLILKFSRAQELPQELPRESDA